jgi:hypothetical protein
MLENSMMKEHFLEFIERCIKLERERKMKSQGRKSGEQIIWRIKTAKRLRMQNVREVKICASRRDGNFVHRIYK